MHHTLGTIRGEQKKIQTLILQHILCSKFMKIISPDKQYKNRLALSHTKLDFKGTRKWLG